MLICVVYPSVVYWVMHSCAGEAVLVGPFINRTTTDGRICRIPVVFEVAPPADIGHVVHTADLQTEQYCTIPHRALHKIGCGEQVRQERLQLASGDCWMLQGELFGDCVPVNGSSEACLMYGGGWGQCAALDQFANPNSSQPGGCCSMAKLTCWSLYWQYGVQSS